MALFALGKLTGLIRQQMVSAAFGTGSDMDAFTSANQLPELFITLVAGGALSAAFIPVYSAYVTDPKRQEGLRIANTILTLVLLLLGGISAIGALIAPWLTQNYLAVAVAPEQQTLISDLMRIVLIQTALFGVSGVLSSILHSHQHFALPALTNIALDVGYVIGLLWLTPSMGIYGLAWGTVIGAMIHVGIQLPALIKYRFRFRPQLALRLAGVREIIRLMLPRLATISSVQAADLAIIRFTNSVEGATSSYFLGYYLQQLPETLIGTAIAVVIFPTLAELYNVGDLAKMKQTAVSALQLIWTLSFPAVAGLILLGKPTIILAFQRGAFTAESTRFVYSILIVLSFRVIGEATLEIVARLLYAQHDTLTPMLGYLGWLILHVALIYWLFPIWGAQGIALASSVSFAALASVLFGANRRKLGSLNERALAATLLRNLAATAGMSLVVWGITQLIQSPLWLVVVGGFAGATVYLLLNHLLGGRELPQLIALIRRH